MRNSNVLVLVRADGWPNGLGKILLGAGLALVLLTLTVYHPTPVRGQVDTREYIQRVGLLLVVVSALLLLWRRGVTLDARTATLTRWWGFAGPTGSLVLREIQTRSYQGYSGIRVMRTRPTEHYKRWRRDMFHVQLEKPPSLGGQIGLRERIIVDDEFPAHTAAARAGRRLADFLELDVIAEVR